MWCPRLQVLTNHLLPSSIFHLQQNWAVKNVYICNLCVICYLEEGGDVFSDSIGSRVSVTINKHTHRC